MHTLPFIRSALISIQDQTAKASEARLFEAELARERQETASLRQQLQDAQSIEKERKKLAERCEKYEQKVSWTWLCSLGGQCQILRTDGRYDIGEGGSEGS